MESINAASTICSRNNPRKVSKDLNVSPHMSDLLPTKQVHIAPILQKKLIPRCSESSHQSMVLQSVIANCTWTNETTQFVHMAQPSCNVGCYRDRIGLLPNDARAHDIWFAGRSSVGANMADGPPRCGGQTSPDCLK